MPLLTGSITLTTVSNVLCMGMIVMSDTGSVRMATWGQSGPVLLASYGLSSVLSGFKIPAPVVWVHWFLQLHPDCYMKLITGTRALNGGLPTSPTGRPTLEFEIMWT